MKEKLRELLTLFLFIFGSAVVSLLAMNLLAFPLTLFAVQHKIAFTLAVKAGIIVLAISYIAYRIARRVILTKKEGLSVINALGSSLLRKFKSLVFFLLVLLLSIVLISAIYFLLSSNYNILYKMMQ
jgi:hypothetical protein